MKHLKIITILFILVNLNSPARLYACSTFLLSSDSCLLVGHNLEENHSVPGYLIINQSGLIKSNISWNEVLRGANENNKRISWVSKYGSVTFNPGGGKEFPDGGMNEQGLVVCEMSLGETKYPTDNTNAKMFMMQWIQYQLDNYKSVNEVVEHINEFELDGWGWHFFIADSYGKKVIVEFLNEKCKIYNEDDALIPVLCNAKYADELKNLRNFKGYGGSQNIDLSNKEEKNKVVNANYLIDNYKNMDAASTKQYGFSILEQLNNGGIAKWSIIYDIKNMKIHFRTETAKDIKYVDFKEIDFSCKKKSLVYNLDLEDIKGDISKKLTLLRNKEIKGSLKKMWSQGLQEEPFLTRILVKKWATKGMLNYSTNIICEKTY